MSMKIEKKEITKEDIIKSLNVIKSVCKTYEYTGEETGKEMQGCNICPFGSDTEGEDYRCMIIQNGSPSQWNISTVTDVWRALK